MSATTPTQPTDYRPLIAARKYALVVTPSRGMLGSLIMRLRSNGFRVAVAPKLGAVLSAIERTPWLSLLVIDGSAVTTKAAVAAREVRQKHPELPILWVEAAQRPEAAFDTNVVVASAKAQDILQKTEGLLAQRFYPGFLLDGVAESTLSVLRETFQAEAELLSVSLKLTRSPLGTLIPVLNFAGGDLSGHLVLNTSPTELRALRRKIIRGSLSRGQADLGDLGGELLNQVLGRLKAHAHRYGMKFELGLPMIITGEKTVLRFPRAAPSAIFDFAAVDRHIYLEFSLTTMELSGSPEVADAEGLEAGEICFL
jgi:CheY-specific phosphatase CheX